MFVLTPLLTPLLTRASAPSLTGTCRVSSCVSPRARVSARCSSYRDFKRVSSLKTAFRGGPFFVCKEAHSRSKEWRHQGSIDVRATAVEQRTLPSVKDLESLNASFSLDKLSAFGGQEGLAKMLQTDLKHGIDIDTVPNRYEQFGRNVFPEPPSKSLWQLFSEACEDTTLRILFGAACISLFIGNITDQVFHQSATNFCTPTLSTGLVLTATGTTVPGWIEGASILTAVFVVASVTSLNNFSKEKQFRALNAVKNDRQVQVIRSGRRSEISIFDVCVGDVALLEAGDQVPADGIFVDGFDLRTDESALTGEVDSVKKDRKAPFFRSGCQVTSGVGRMLVTAVGPHSEWGLILARLAERGPPEEETTPLQLKLSETANTIGQIGVGAAAATVGALLIRWTSELINCPYPFEWRFLEPLLDFFITGITIIVVAVPEGLPLAVTISLSYSVKKMLKDNNLVRQLDACETMGGATNICSDKTGTLTENRMTVVRCYLGGIDYPTVPDPASINPSLVSVLNAAISLNSTATLNDLPDGRVEFLGSRTECALLMMARQLRCNVAQERQDAIIKAIYAFSSDTKRMGTVIELPGGTFRLYEKGAPEKVLEFCRRMMSADGSIVPITDDDRAAIETAVSDMAASGLRTLCLAYGDVHSDDLDGWKQSDLEQDLVLVGLVGIRDPVRAEVPEAVEECKKAGIRVRMCTGDNIKTASHIARECGILSEDGVALLGEDFRAMSDEQLDALLPRLDVLARASPTDKLRLVRRLRQQGEIVAVTGDGTNDAPALRTANVGLSMGICGTEVAKEASDIVLMDDNFRSIVNAVMWGRCVYDNIRKFVQFQLTVNAVALVVAFVSAVSDLGRPLKPVQLLWVNLIMDSLGALALGTEPPTRSLLDRKPRDPSEPLISPTMTRNIVGQSLYQLGAMFSLLFGLGGSPLFLQQLHSYYEPLYGSQFEGPALAAIITNTVVFNSFVFCQIANEFNCRKLDDKDVNVFAGVGSNGLFSLIIAITAAIQVLIVQYGGVYFETIPLSQDLWVLCLLIGAGSIPYGFLLRKLPPLQVPNLWQLKGEGKEQS